MSLARRIAANDGLRSFLCWLGAGYIRLVYRTSRWQAVRPEIPNAFWDEGKGFILAFWHGRGLMMPCCWKKGAPMKMLISQHRDGELIAKMIRHFGLGTVRGSTKRGGSGALRQMVKALSSDACVGITPDGPQGPRMRANPGAITVARLSGRPILPVAYSLSRRRVLSSWDRFVIAFPFARGALVWGEPLRVAREADEARQEALRRELEDRLNRITEEADRLVGQSVVKPAADPGAPER
ncbi:MAG: lysophospholipid acyltransferase family protein [Proteobacteria bacterium]|nr:lysophospholipid acyltransferase family protein [Pseudomonadota bacterium]